MLEHKLSTLTDAKPETTIGENAKTAEVEDVRNLISADAQLQNEFSTDVS